MVANKTWIVNSLITRVIISRVNMEIDLIKEFKLL